MNSTTKMLLFVLLAILPITTTTIAVQAQTSVSSSHAKGKFSYSVKNVSGEFQIEYEGDIELSDDDKDIISISRGGYFELSKSSFGASRKIKIESDGDGLQKQYFVGRSEENWEPDGKNWLAEILPDLVRSTTIAAKSRVNRIYSKGGSEALVREIGLLKGDYVSHAYLILAFEKPLYSNDQVRLLDVAGRQVNSDHYLSEVLTAYFNKFGLTASSTEPFLKAAANINSDHYKSNVLSAVAKSDQIRGQELTRLIQGADGINSDHYKSGVLIEILKRKKLDEKQLAALLTETSDIQSDHYRTNVLITISQEQTLTPAVMNQFVSTAGQMQSDNYQQNVFVEILKKPQDEQTLALLFNQAGSSMDSDHYLGEVLKTGIRYQQFSGKAMGEFITAIGSIGSDHYASEVIQEASKKKLSEENTIGLLSAAGRIGSDHYLSTSLVALSGQVNNMDSRVKDAYRAAAKQISSETYYGRAMKALD